MDASHVARGAHLSCGNCDYFLEHALKHLPELPEDDPAVREQAIAVARADHERRKKLADAAGRRLNDGDCRRYSQPVAKEETDRCGEHPELAAQRARDLAAPIAAVIDKLAALRRGRAAMTEG